MGTDTVAPQDAGALGGNEPVEGGPGGAPAPVGSAGRVRRALRAAARPDAVVVLAYLCAGVYLLSHVWRDPYHRYVEGNWQDSVQVGWFLTHATRLFTHGDNPLFTELINAPHGVNLMANTSLLALALPLAPVTLLLGSEITFALLLTLAPALTSCSWYWFLSRHVVRSRVAAFLGALFAGFAPAMVSHDTGHPNIVSQFLLPPIVIVVLRWRRPGRAVRTGLELAGLVVLQVFVNEEILFLGALSLVLFLLFLAVNRPSAVLPHVRRALVGSAVCAGAAGAVLAYPLWHQFSGPMAYRGLPEFVLGYGSDLAAFWSRGSESLFAAGADAQRLSQGTTEENTFFGPTLLVVLGLAVLWRLRDPVVRSLASTAAVLATLSLGAEITVGGRGTGVTGPWAALRGLPLLDSVVPTRVALFLTPLIALLLALALDHAARPVAPALDHAARPAPAAGATSASPVPGRRWSARRVVWTCAVLAALVPLTPSPIDAAVRPPVPRLFSTGAWREVVPEGGTVLVVPMTWDRNVDMMHWQVAADLGFAVPGGYYLAPAPTGADRRAGFGPRPLPTVQFLAGPASTGTVPVVTTAVREQARRDLTEWRVDAVVVAADTVHVDALRMTLDALLSPARLVDGAWVWTVDRSSGTVG